MFDVPETVDLDICARKMMPRLRGHTKSRNDSAIAEAKKLSRDLRRQAALLRTLPRSTELRESEHPILRLIGAVESSSSIHRCSIYNSGKAAVGIFDDGGTKISVQPNLQTVMDLTIGIGVLALQGAFVEHIKLLRYAATEILFGPASVDSQPEGSAGQQRQIHFEFIEVRTPAELSKCSGLIIPGGESTSISLLAERTGLLEPLRDFVRVRRKPVWGTCAGLILLAESANKTKLTGQELIGGLDVKVQRNYFGRQTESFEAELELPFLGEGGEPFHSVFIRAPVVESITSTSSHIGDASEDIVTAPAKKETIAPVEVLGRLPPTARALTTSSTTAKDLGEDGDIVVVRQGNVFGTAFHPELTGDARIHAWWLQEVVRAVVGDLGYPVATPDISR